MCGNTLKAQAKSIAILQIVCCSIVIVGGSGIWIYLINEDPYHEKMFREQLVFGAVGVVVSLILAIFLLAGVQKESISKCGVWYYFNFFFLVLFIFLTIILGLAGQGSIISELIGIMMNAYFLYIVKSFMKKLELKKGERDQNSDTSVDFNEV